MRARHLILEIPRSPCAPRLRGGLGKRNGGGQGNCFPHPKAVFWRTDSRRETSTTRNGRAWQTPTTSKPPSTCSSTSDGCEKRPPRPRPADRLLGHLLHLINPAARAATQKGGTPWVKQNDAPGKMYAPRFDTGRFEGLNAARFTDRASASRAQDELEQNGPPGSARRTGMSAFLATREHAAWHGAGHAVTARECWDSPDSASSLLHSETSPCIPSAA